MLWNPNHDRKEPVEYFDVSKPSLEGFGIFVALQILRNPNARYVWDESTECPVASYLQSLGCYYDNWQVDAVDDVTDGETPSPRCALLYLLDNLARGNGQWRDARGRFTSQSEEISQWTYKKLFERIQARIEARKNGCVIEHDLALAA